MLEAHPIADIFPMMSDEDYAALIEDMRRHGQLEPIWLVGNQILDGRNRAKACQEIGIDPLTRTYTGPTDTPSLVSFVVSLNLKRRHLNSGQRAVLALEIERVLGEALEEQRREKISHYRSTGETIQTFESSKPAAEQAAAIVGTNRQYVSDAKRIAAAAPDLLDKVRDGSMGIQAAKREVHERERQANPGAPQQFIATEEDDQLDKYEQMIEDSHARANAARRQQIAVITGSSESNEWYTPAVVIELARAVLEEIDLDPASCAAANETVQATEYYTAEDDGFTKPWHGRVWLNPPYGREENESETNATRWSKKLIAEYEAGRVSSALLLVKAALGYNWFEDLWVAYPTCLLRRRLAFIAPDGSSQGQAKHATAILYLGPDVDTFQRVFRQVGRVILPEVEE